MRQRVGFGYDSHRFGAQRPLVLAGVQVPHSSGLLGHSDGDAVAHAVADALLGAGAMGDLGRLFPDTDPRWQDADSMQLLAEVKRRISAAGFRIVNLDVTVVTEAPKLAPHAEAMRSKLAQVLALPLGAVSLKAKTNEGLDAVGAGLALQVFAIAALEDG
jgi:2-C-methyl-D-erythritol 2,4-cyclodiphosphate synthase